MLPGAQSSWAAIPQKPTQSPIVVNGEMRLEAGSDKKDGRSKQQEQQQQEGATATAAK